MIGITKIGIRAVTSHPVLAVPASCIRYVPSPAVNAFTYRELPLLSVAGLYKQTVPPSPFGPTLDTTPPTQSGSVVQWVSDVCAAQGLNPPPPDVTP